MSSPSDQTAGRPVRAMVMAAGFGTRLRPHTDALPKALYPVAGRPMIEYPLGWLSAWGVTDVIVNLHYFGDRIEAALGDGARLGLNLRYSREQELLGTGGGVARAMKRFGPATLLVVNCDTIIDADLTALLDRHRRAEAIATLAMIEAPDPQNYTRVLVDRHDSIAAIGDRPAAGARLFAAGQARPLTFSGLSVLSPELVAYLPADRFAHLAADGLVPALEDGRRVAAYLHRGRWMALDSIEKIREAEAEIGAKKKDENFTRRHGDAEGAEKK